MAALREGDVQLARHIQFRHVAAAATGGPDADEIDRAMADVVIAVARKILRREFPVARHPPFLDAAQDFGAAVAAVPGIEGQVDIGQEIAEIFEKGRRLGVPSGPYRALVAAQLRDLDEAPGRPVQCAVIGLAEIGDTDELAVGRIAPAVIGAGQYRGVALVIAAHLHAAMPAGIQEHMDLAGTVAAQDHRLLAHRRDEEVAGVRDLALVPDKEPSAGEDPFQLFLVDLVVDKDLAADLPRRHVDEARAIPDIRASLSSLLYPRREIASSATLLAMTGTVIASEAKQSRISL